MRRISRFSKKTESEHKQYKKNYMSAVEAVGLLIDDYNRGYMITEEYISELATQFGITQATLESARRVMER